MIPRFLIVSLMGGAIASTALGDLPSVAQLSEAQPPTREQWFAYYYHRQAREAGFPGRHHCAKPACVGPLDLREEVIYYPCMDCSCGPAGCGEQSTGSLCDGPACGYGIRHPAPYYIPNPVLAIERPERCHGARATLRHPNNRVEVTLGIWE